MPILMHAFTNHDGSVLYIAEDAVEAVRSGDGDNAGLTQIIPRGAVANPAEWYGVTESLAEVVSKINGHSREQVQAKITALHDAFCEAAAEARSE